jgi:LysM repeat protein
MEIGELNCRLLNPRKMTVRIDTGITVKTSENKNSAPKEFEPPSFLNLGDPDEADGIHIEKLKREFEICDVITGDGEAKTEENIMITDGPPANEIIYADVNTIVDDVKPLNGKAVVKYTSHVKVMYNTVEDKNGCVKVNREIPGTHIVDMDDLDESYECSAKIALSSLKTDIDIDQHGENKILNVDFILQVDVSAFKNNEREIVVDAYAPKYENSVQNESIRVQRYKGIYRENQNIEDSTVLEDESIEEVMDAAGLIVVNNVSVGESVVTVNSSAELSVMVKGTDGDVQEIACSIPVKCEIGSVSKIFGGTTDVSGQISNIDAFIDNGKLNIKAQISHECIVFENEVCNMAKAIIIDPECQKTGKKDVQMVIYYPNNTETLWSVAKKYDSQVSKIMKYNKLETQNLEDKKIIIVPRV